MPENKTELVACPFCGGEAAYKYLPNLGVKISHAIGCTGCSVKVFAQTEAEAIVAWNRRYVCDDKNGEAVYAGDEVGIHWPGEEKSKAIVTFDLRWGYLFEDEPDAWTYDEVGEIELIQGSEDDNE